MQHHRGGQRREAERIYRQILASDPGHAAAAHQLASSRSKKDTLRRPSSTFDKPFAPMVSRAAFHNTLGEAYRLSGQTREAVACYHRALGLQPRYAEACNNLGVALTDLGESDEAITQLRKALKWKPHFARR